MTPLAKLLRNAWEKTFGTFYEGVATPRRFPTYAEEFARANPYATVAEWIAFSKNLADEAYRAGWVRGWERTERDASAPLPSTADVELAVAEQEGQPRSWMDGAPTSAALALDGQVPTEPPGLGRRAYDAEQEGLEFHRWWLEQNRAARGPRRI